MSFCRFNHHCCPWTPKVCSLSSFFAGCTCSVSRLNSPFCKNSFPGKRKSAFGFVHNDLFPVSRLPMCFQWVWSRNPMVAVQISTWRWLTCSWLRCPPDKSDPNMALGIGSWPINRGIYWEFNKQSWMILTAKSWDCTSGLYSGQWCGDGSRHIIRFSRV